jgi:hypothetical protein
MKSPSKGAQEFCYGTKKREDGEGGQKLSKIVSFMDDPLSF